MMQIKAMQNVVEFELKDVPLQLSNDSEPAVFYSVHECRNRSCQQASPWLVQEDASRHTIIQTAKSLQACVLGYKSQSTAVVAVVTTHLNLLEEKIIQQIKDHNSLTVRKRNTEYWKGRDFLGHYDQCFSVPGMHHAFPYINLQFRYKLPYFLPILLLPEYSLCLISSMKINVQLSESVQSQLCYSSYIKTLCFSSTCLSLLFTPLAYLQIIIIFLDRLCFIMLNKPRSFNTLSRGMVSHCLCTIIYLNTYSSLN